MFSSGSILCFPGFACAYYTHGGVHDCEALACSVLRCVSDREGKNSNAKCQCVPCSSFASSLSLILTTRLVREILSLEQTPGIISLLSGKPDPVSFPITDVRLTIRNAAALANGPGTPITLDKSALAEGLQYGHTMGYRPLLDWLFGFQKHFHGRSPGEGWRISMGSEAQDLLYKMSKVNIR